MFVHERFVFLQMRLLEFRLRRGRARLRDDGEEIGRIRAGAPVNASDHGPYRDYYDDELRDLVGKACRPLIERFGYRFEPDESQAQ